MKTKQNNIKIGLILFLIGLNSFLFSQIQTLCNSYTLNAPYPNGIKPISKVYGNSIYVLLNETSGPTLTKLNLDGVPIFKKVFSYGFYPEQINVNNGFLYVSGNSGYASQSVPFLLKLDTANCNTIFFNLYTVSNYSQTLIRDAKFLNDGNLLLVGAASNTSSPTVSSPRYGLFIGVNANSGNVVYSSTLSIGNTTNNTIYTFCEISNSSIIFTSTGPTAYIGRAFKTSTTFSVNSTNYIFGGNNFDVNQTSNLKKLLLVSGTNYNKGIFKIDTALNLLNSNPPGIALAPSSPECCFYINDRLYCTSAPLNQLEIYDTTLNFVSGKNYPIMPLINSSYNTKNMTSDNTSLYSVFFNSIETSKYCLLKTDLNGYMNCSTPQTVNTATSSLSAFNYTFASGNISVNSVTMSISANSDTTAYTSFCSNFVGIQDNNLPSVKIYPNPTKDKLHLEMDSNISIDFINVVNFLGIKMFEMNSNSKEIDISNLPSGLYFLSIQVNHQIKTYKIVKE